MAGAQLEQLHRLVLHHSVCPPNHCCHACHYNIHVCPAALAGHATTGAASPHSLVPHRCATCAAPSRWPSTLCPPTLCTSAWSCGASSGAACSASGFEGGLRAGRCVHRRVPAAAARGQVGARRGVRCLFGGADWLCGRQLAPGRSAWRESLQLWGKLRWLHQFCHTTCERERVAFVCVLRTGWQTLFVAACAAVFLCAGRAPRRSLSCGKRSTRGSWRRMWAAATMPTSCRRVGSAGGQVSWYGMA